MKYMLMINHNPAAWAELNENEQWDLMKSGGRLWEELVASGEGIIGEPLASPSAARTVRVRNGVTDFTDGPYAETKEQFVGFLLINVASQERAEEIAASWPDARVGSLVVREINVGNDSM